MLRAGDIVRRVMGGKRRLRSRQHQVVPAENSGTFVFSFLEHVEVNCGVSFDIYFIFL